MDLVIVTGMSGAGKTQAINALEDIGYYCVDNVPPKLISKFAELPEQSEGKISKIALVVDVRSRDMFSDYIACVDELLQSKYSFKMLFLEAQDQILIRRYKETRRRHPLLTPDMFSIENAIKMERELLFAAKSRADFVIDTTALSPTAMKNRVRELFLDGVSQTIMIGCTSFGFKHGTPSDCDLMFDVRCLPNPFYIDQLSDLTGLDMPVKDYVLSFKQAIELIPKLFDLIDYLLPLYIQEGKSQLIIAIGCTGGKHRSVVFTELLAKHLLDKGFTVSVNHRDIALSNVK